MRIETPPRVGSPAHCHSSDGLSADGEGCNRGVANGRRMRKFGPIGSVLGLAFLALGGMRAARGFRRANRTGDVEAHLGEGTAVGGGERVEVVGLYLFASHGAAGAHVAAGGVVYGPHRVDHRRFAADRVEALDVEG